MIHFIHSRHARLTPPGHRQFIAPLAMSKREPIVPAVKQRGRGK